MLNRLAPPGQALTAARDLAHRILRAAPSAVSAAFAVARHPAKQDERQLWQLGEAWWETMTASPNAAQGPKAFK